MDKTNLAYWFPILQTSGVLVPKTIIVEANPDIVKAGYGEPTPELPILVCKIERAASEFGYPFFLRTGHTSGKHGWKKTCFVSSKEGIEPHIREIIEYGEVASMMGLPVETWVIREFLDLETKFTAFYGKMPINKERRYFFDNGKVICHHPYWPTEAFEREETDNWKEALEYLNQETSEEVNYLTEQTRKVAKVFEGAWSIDWAATSNQWYAIDMAEAHRSYHWETCPDKGNFRDIL